MENNEEVIQLVELDNALNNNSNNNNANRGYDGTSNMSFMNPQYTPFGVYNIVSEYNNLAAQNVSLVKQLGDMKKVLLGYKNEISNLQEGLIGSDWQLRQDDTQNIIWMTDGKKHEILMEAAIKKVTPYVFFVSEKRTIVFEVEFHFPTGERRIAYLKLDDLESPKKFINKLENMGIPIRIKRSNSIKCQILKRHILGKITDDTITLMPYLGGWNDHVFCYCTEESSHRLDSMNINLPYMRRFFSENAIDCAKIKEQLELLYSNFGRVEASIILAITAGSLLYTELFSIGYYLDALFVLDTQNSCMTDIRKWMQPWKKEINCTLSNKKTLIKSMQESKDEAIFLIDEGTLYSLRLNMFLKSLSEDNEILIGNGTDSLHSVPILITNRRDVWKLHNLRLINLSFHGRNRIYTEKDVISCFWKYFCNSASDAYDIWMNQLLSLNITPYQGKEFKNIYNWIVTAYHVLFPCLNVTLGVNSRHIMIPQKFEKYVDTWLYRIEQKGQMDLAEEFIFGIKQLKNQNQLNFTKNIFDQTKVSDRYTVSIDNEFIYIVPNTFTSMVNYLLPGCSPTEVYNALVEDGNAKKGDGTHLFPKCSVKISDKRERMAAIYRELLLSDAEILLGV